MGPTQQRAPGPPRYATRGNCSRGKGDKPRRTRGLCPIREVSMLDGECSPHSGKMLSLQCVVPRLRRGGLADLLGDLALELADLRRQLVVAGLQQPIVEAADMLDRPEAARRHAQLH